MTATLIRLSQIVGIDRNPYITTSPNPAIDTDICDSFEITGLIEDIVSMSTNLTGTPDRNQTLHIVITGTASRAIVWGTSFEGDLPTATVGTARLDIMLVWNAATSKWRGLTWVSG
jgi:hypothetical protein